MTRRPPSWLEIVLGGGALFCFGWWATQAFVAAFFARAGAFQ